MDVVNPSLSLSLSLLLVDSLVFRPDKPGWLQRTSNLTPLLLLLLLPGGSSFPAKAAMRA